MAEVISLGEGTLSRSRASEVVHQETQVETRDYEDHTFAGIMFDVISRDKMPIEYMEINAVWVRGELGPMTVWVTDGTHEEKEESQEKWTKVHDATHPASPLELRSLVLDVPLKLKPGDTMGLYVHSGTEGDEQIVYDNQRLGHADEFIKITSGKAHLCNIPFSRSGTHGQHWWGSPWRQRREFVGRIDYGIRWLLWNPDTNNRMPVAFKNIVWALLMTRHERARCSYLWHLETEMLFFILNKVEWWTMGDMKQQVEWQPPGYPTDLRTKQEGAPDDHPIRGYYPPNPHYGQWAAIHHSNVFHHALGGTDSDEDYEEEEDSDDEEYIPRGGVMTRAAVAAAEEEEDDEEEEDLSPDDDGMQEDEKGANDSDGGEEAGKGGEGCGCDENEDE